MQSMKFDTVEVYMDVEYRLLKKTKTNKSIVVELTGRTLTENNFRGKFELVMSQHNEQ